MVLLDWTRLFPRQFLYFDVASTIPVELLELYVLVIVAFAVRKRLDAARWMVAVASAVAALETAVSDMSGLGIRWTHWTLHHQLYRTLFTLAGAPINVSTFAQLFLLASILYAAWGYLVEQSQRQSALEQEFRSAQEIQQILIPDDLPTIAGYSLTSAYVPAQEVGGDFFQIIPLTNEAEGGGVRDDRAGRRKRQGVKGSDDGFAAGGSDPQHGGNYAGPGGDPDRVNPRLHGRMQNGFATCRCLRLDAFGGGTLANAGHLPPFLNGRELALLPALPLGLVAEADYETTAVHLKAGDRLTLYTDGLLEARNAAENVSFEAPGPSAANRGTDREGGEGVWAGRRHHGADADAGGGLRLAGPGADDSFLDLGMRPRRGSRRRRRSQA